MDLPLIFVLLWLYIIVTHAFRYQSRQENNQQAVKDFFYWLCENDLTPCAKDSSRWSSRYGFKKPYYNDLTAKEVLEAYYTAKIGGDLILRHQDLREAEYYKALYDKCMSYMKQLSETGKLQVTRGGFFHSGPICTQDRGVMLRLLHELKE